MVFQLIAGIAAEIAMTTYSMTTEIKSALGGRAENIENIVSARNETNAEGIKLAHDQYEQLAEEQRRMRGSASGSTQSTLISGGSFLSSLCMSSLMMMMVVATAAS
jgi:hypothetical protein